MDGCTLGLIEPPNHRCPSYIYNAIGLYTGVGPWISAEEYEIAQQIIIHTEMPCHACKKVFVNIGAYMVHLNNPCPGHFAPAMVKYLSKDELQELQRDYDCNPWPEDENDRAISFCRLCTNSESASKWK